MNSRWEAGIGDAHRPVLPPPSWPVLALALWLGVGASFAQTVENPRRLAEGPSGQLLVADRSLGAVVAVDEESLQPVWSFPLPGEGAPFGLATWNRLVFVGNTTTRNVEVYRMLGAGGQGMQVRFAYNLGDTPAGEVGTIGNPISVGLDSREQLVFVLDGDAKEVKIFDRRGPFVRSFAPADETGVVLSPVSLAVDPVREEVLVGDYGDPSGSFRARKPARILIYDYYGELLFRIDGNGSTHPSAQFARVQGMAVSADGRIFAAEPLGGRILVLDRDDGELLAVVGAGGPEPGQLMLPSDVYLDPETGDLFVSNNRGARRVEVFRGAGR